MNQQYEIFLKQCQNLEFKVRDLIDDANQSLGQALVSETKRLVDEVETEKNPRSLEAQVKNIQNVLDRIKDQDDSIMDYRHVSFLHESYEQLKLSLRKFDNY